MGAVYIFNLIVGAGALAMPHSFSESGYLGGAVLPHAAPSHLLRGTHECAPRPLITRLVAADTARPCPFPSLFSFSVPDSAITHPHTRARSPRVSAGPCRQRAHCCAGADVIHHCQFHDRGDGHCQCPPTKGGQGRPIQARSGHRQAAAARRRYTPCMCTHPPTFCVHTSLPPVLLSD